MSTQDYTGLVVEQDGERKQVATHAKGWLTFEDGSKSRVKGWEVCDEQPAKRSMAGTLNAYRGNYEPSLSACGRKSLNCGDDLAGLLAGLEPEQVIKLAELALDLEVGTLQAKYEALNPGQKRMNAGNRIRAAIKRGDLDVATIKTAAGGVVGLQTED